MKRLFSFIIFLFITYISFGQTITTIVGTGTAGFSGDWGPPTAAEINGPNAISFGSEGAEGSLYLVDKANNRVRQIKLGGIIFTKAGNGTTGFSGDGGLATAAALNQSGGVAVDNAWNVYIGDYDNNRIRKVDIYGNITTYGGTGVAGFSGDGGQATAAQFHRPYNVVVDKKGNVIFADQYNHRIRKIDTSGIVTTIAGNGSLGFSGDGGPGTAAQIAYPNYVHIDSIGRLYITDNGHHRIRKLDTNGIITTIAGNGIGGYSGDGGAATNAQLQYPGGATVDNSGNVLICDAVNNRIRKVDAITGIITTIAGTGVAGYSGDGGAATAAMVDEPIDIIVDHLNNIYFCDNLNNRIRKISATSVNTASINNEPQNIFIYPNPTNGVLNIEWVNQGIGSAEIVIVDCLGRCFYNSVITFNSKSGNTKLVCSGLQNGLYWFNVKSANQNFTYCVQIFN